MDLSFYNGKTVFLTGHTGFKGSWMCEVLSLLGAKVIGYSLAPISVPSLFEELSVASKITSILGDVRDTRKICDAMMQYRPQIAIHMAAQPIVRTSYDDPVYTYETNVMGTVNFLEAVRLCDSVKSVINVTTDKVYRNNEWDWGYREIDALDGHDPYSNSKSCSELVTSSYKKSFFSHRDIAVSSCRAGNVIGGGDFAIDRIIPDCVRAMENKTEIIVRNPDSTRPYQHVLEPICAYLMIAMRQYDQQSLQGCYNVGPDNEDCVSTGVLVDLFCRMWGEGAIWKKLSSSDAPHEASLLKLDCDKVKNTFGWIPSWHIAEAVEKTVQWSKCRLVNENIAGLTQIQIQEYLNGGNV